MHNLIAQNLIEQNKIKYWIYFTDKNESPYSVENPEQFLSQKAIDRRHKYHITIQQNDLPVNPQYIQQIKNKAVTVIAVSKSINAISALLSPDDIVQISTLPFVTHIEPVSRYKADETERSNTENSTFYRLSYYDQNYYGVTWNQFHMMNGDYLHKLGYTGKGMTIAVLDAGFPGVDVTNAFQSYWDKNQILGHYNFADDTNFVFSFSSHGTEVLSIMAADIPNVFVGAAPDANYYLFRTEIADSEYVVEEDYWAQAAERADSVGVDMINSSLGYTTFDDSLQNHTYADMDGNTTVITRAADWAASKGILVCNSAGNEAQSPWHFIGAPADGDSVFTIGAVDKFRDYAAFSSVGPTSDGRLKPNVAGQGQDTYVIDPSGNIFAGSGTSFSSPLMCGSVACLWQAFPEKNNIEIMNAIQANASQADHPDFLLGYGIPDLFKTYYYLKNVNATNHTSLFDIFPNPSADYATILLYGKENGDALIDIFDAVGRQVQTYTVATTQGELTPLLVDNIERFAAGIYLVHVHTSDMDETQEFMVR